MNISKDVIAGNNKNYIKFRRLIENYGIGFLVIIIMGIFGILNPRFLSIGNILNLSRQIVPIGFIALGAMFILIGGGLDLSLGVGATITGAIMGIIFYLTGNIFLSIIVCIFSGLVIGATDGLLITKLNFSPIIATLAMMVMLQGVIQLILGGRILYVDSPVLQYISRGTVGKIPFAFIFLMIFYILGYFLLEHTKYGVYLRAIGGDENNAKITGINIPLVKFFSYIMAAFLMCMSGIVLVSRMALISPAMSGFSMLLDGFSAAVIGGTSVTGGKGNVVGVFLGVIFIVIITNALVFLKVPSESQDLYRGLLIAFTLIFERLVRMRK